MKQCILIGLLTIVWLILIANIFCNETDGRWMIEDVEKVAQLEVARYTSHIMIVSVSDEDVALCLYEREDVDKIQENSGWELVLETNAIIGKNGLGKTKEGDGKTPIGVFRFVKAFGILENPGTKVEYIQTANTHYWIDDCSSKYYNQYIEVNDVDPDWKSAEHILQYGEAYHYVLATSYNIERIPGKGSAVFLHCIAKDSEATAGCVAVPEVYMREIMKRVESECVLIIDEVENILKY